MNCPHHAQIFKGEQRSYKDLPVRFAETTTVYRDEKPGELLGLSRVLSITQDDGHIFCTKEQIKNELDIILNIIKEFYTSLGMFKGVCGVFVSVRDPKNKDKYLGGDDLWEYTEKELINIVKQYNLPYSYEEGEAAFYGPKIDFNFKDSLGRVQQLATVQLDFNMPERLELTYIDNKGKKQTPIMIHRAVSGSLERFMSVLIEHFGGHFPLWLSPVQVKIIPISQNEITYGEGVLQKLTDEGIRAEMDRGDDKIGKKIYNAKTERVPYRIIIGKTEVDNNQITLENESDKKVISIEECLELLKKEINN